MIWRIIPVLSINFVSARALINNSWVFKLNNCIQLLFIIAQRKWWIWYSKNFEISLAFLLSSGWIIPFCLAIIVSLICNVLGLSWMLHSTKCVVMNLMVLLFSPWLKETMKSWSWSLSLSHTLLYFTRKLAHWQWQNTSWIILIWPLWLYVLLQMCLYYLYLKLIFLLLFHRSLCHAYLLAFTVFFRMVYQGQHIKE